MPACHGADLVQDLHLLEPAEVVIRQNTEDRDVTPGGALHLPFDPEEPFFRRDLKLRPGGERLEHEAENEHEPDPLHEHLGDGGLRDSTESCVATPP